ncbi:NAD-dependent epimerase/dehydratase family protein [Methylobacterium sp. J-067]|uniref:NAD-dependent epimerase/dehydratase family protein n=1 Tax=Methylobacterium sp. J-067 TaxID=2836648 RepID=UPI001FB8E99D|nr:NAD-dependent epimerase/dehydratase family protein [Methylobacterium sp. J-067]MCJ2022794.1 NAD-dependent epimerase/dehydratase family protein [Methylobacterium sp. J-067]
MSLNDARPTNVPPHQRRALLTGATGYVGGWLLAELLRSGWIVHTLGRRAGDHSGVTTHLYDGGIASVSRAVEAAAPDVVFHLASAVAIDHTADGAAEILAANITFPTLILEAMAALGYRNFVNTGTSWQHFDGTDAYNPTNLYAATKQAFEDVARYYVEAKAFNVLTLRLFDVYGPADPRRKLLPYLVGAALRNEPVSLSPGLQTLDLVHVSDVTSAFLVAAERLLAAPRGMEVFLVRSGEIVSVRDLVDRIATALGMTVDAKFGGRPYRDREVMKPWDAHSTLPGWSPKVDLGSGLRQLVAVARQQASDDGTV